MKSFAPDHLKQIKDRVCAHFEKIYPKKDCSVLTQKALEIFKQDISCSDDVSDDTLKWSQKDIILITYGNTLIDKDAPPLKTLHHFLNVYLKELISIVHILPFFPYSSDEGFAVMDYYRVNPSLGDWEDIQAIAEDFRLMSDLVINHTSSRSTWFENFKKGRHPGRDYYVTVDPLSDLSQVIRPRTSPLLREVKTPEGSRHVWCTFSHDQVDLNFKNPDVLIEFLHIVKFYLEKGVQVFRLDAVAFLWKELCTTCLHLDQTHEIIKLLRTLVETVNPQTLLITETNVPSEENISYLGKGDEAHIIYNFPLPPLLLNTMITGDSQALVQWMTSVPHLLPGTSCLNFIASHDGIGLRPVEGFLSQAETDRLVGCMKSFGAKISTRALNEQQSNPYEINISLWDAFKGTIESQPDQWQLERFVCAHAVMLCLQGIPAFYIHSLLGTPNDYERMENLQNNRAINRHIWEAQKLYRNLEEKDSHHYKVFAALRWLIDLRKQQSAFHPQSGQSIIPVDSRMVVIYRTAQSLPEKTEEAILCVYNITQKPVSCEVGAFSPTGFSGGLDLMSKKKIKIDDKLELLPYSFLWIKGRNLTVN